MDPISNAPLRKNHEGVIGANDRIPVLRDAQNLSTDNMSSSAIELFPPNPSSDVVGRNYDDNPLPGDYSKRIVGLGFSFSYGTLTPATGVDPLAILNALKHAAVVLSRGDRRKQILRDHLTQYVDFSKAQVVTAAYDDGTNSDSTEHVVLPTTSFLKRLAESKADDFVLEPDERFSLELEFANTDDIPSDSEWGNATSGILQVLGFIQVVHRHNR